MFQKVQPYKDSLIMATIELRESDMRRAANLNRKNKYGLDSVQMIRLINTYQKGDAYKRALVEFRLTDINFHREVEMLINGKYNELREQVKEW
jgi:aryl carrier-like protein